MAEPHSEVNEIGLHKNNEDDYEEGKEGKEQSDDLTENLVDCVLGLEQRDFGDGLGPVAAVQVRWASRPGGGGGNRHIRNDVQWIRQSHTNCDLLIGVYSFLKSSNRHEETDDFVAQRTKIRALRSCLGQTVLDAIDATHPLKAIDTLSKAVASPGAMDAKLLILHSREVDIVQPDTASALKSLESAVGWTKVKHLVPSAVTNCPKHLRSAVGHRFLVLVIHGDVDALSPLPCIMRGGKLTSLDLKTVLRAFYGIDRLLVCILCCTRSASVGAYLDKHLADRTFPCVLMEHDRGPPLFWPAAFQGISSLLLTLSQGDPGHMHSELKQAAQSLQVPYHKMIVHFPTTSHHAMGKRLRETIDLQALAGVDGLAAATTIAAVATTPDTTVVSVDGNENLVTAEVEMNVRPQKRARLTVVQPSCDHQLAPPQPPPPPTDLALISVTASNPKSSYLSQVDQLREVCTDYWFVSIVL